MTRRELFAMAIGLLGFKVAPAPAAAAGPVRWYYHKIDGLKPAVLDPSLGGMSIEESRKIFELYVEAFKPVPEDEEMMSVVIESGHA